MRLIAVIRAEKSDIEIGKWGNGHVPPSQFALRAKPSSFKLGSAYAWVIVRFTALGHAFRVLILFNESKQIYRAILGVDVGGMVRMICVHEFHMQEPGWHCHAVVDTANAPQGWTRRGMHRTPRGARVDAEFDVRKSNAIQIALKIYRIYERGPLL